MPVSKTPAADLRRQYPRHQQIGAVLALAVVLVAFTVPTARTAPPGVTGTVDLPVGLIPLPPTVQPPPPTPTPPPLPPPPIEVEYEEEDAMMDDFVLDPDRYLPPVTAPPPPPVRPRLDVAPPPPPVLPDHKVDAIVDVPEVEPLLMGGLAGLQARVVYPERARIAEISGQVIVQFVVDERGRVVDPVVLRSPHDLLSNAALEALRESQFQPGQQRGRAVKVRFTVPVTFRLR